MATRTRQPLQRPWRWTDPKRTRRWWTWVAAASGLLGAIAIAAAVLAVGSGGGTGASAAAGLPATPDHHSLLVSATDAGALTLGTHDGLYRSSDGGRTWESATLSGRDAMSLGRGEDRVAWAAGHDVLARSTDGGQTWQEIRPAGLPHLDVHGFAVDPRDRQTLWAALAGQGLYRSTDGGDSFALVTRDVGAGVMALAVAPDGRIFAGDMQRGLFVSADEGRSWELTLEASLMGLAVNPAQPTLILATGPGILRTSDGGETWDQVLPLEAGAGPVAWAATEPSTAYVVGFDRTLYKTEDGGETWQPVGRER